MNNSNANEKVSPIVSAFNTIFNVAPKIEFRDSWNNGTGYFNGASCGENAPKLLIGERVGAISNGRKMIIMGTGLKENVVVFQRYSDRDDIFTFHRPRQFAPFIEEKILNSDEMQFLIGWTLDHVPEVIETWKTSIRNVLHYGFGNEEAKRIFEERFAAFM